IQDVLLKLIDGVRGYVQRPGQPFRSWLRKVAMNRAADFRRRRATRPLPAGDGLLDVEDSGDLFDEAPFRKAMLAQGLTLIKHEFSTEVYGAFVGVMVEGRSVADVAGRLGMSANAVYKARTRALRRLREVIAGLLDE